MTTDFLNNSFFKWPLKERMSLTDGFVITSAFWDYFTKRTITYYGEFIRKPVNRKNLTLFLDWAFQAFQGQDSFQEVWLESSSQQKQAFLMINYQVVEKAIENLVLTQACFTNILQRLQQERELTKDFHQDLQVLLEWIVENRETYNKMLYIMTNVLVNAKNG